MAEKSQYRPAGRRGARVQITYDVVSEEGKKISSELPFVVGVLADLSGQPKPPLKPFKDRAAVYIDRDNFDKVLAQFGARLALQVPNKLTDPSSKLAVELTFNHLDDFEPARLAERIGPFKQLLEMRRALTHLLARLKGNPKLEELLESISSNKEEAMAAWKVLDRQARNDVPLAPSAQEGKSA